MVGGAENREGALFVDESGELVISPPTRSPSCLTRPGRPGLPEKADVAARQAACSPLVNLLLLQRHIFACAGRGTLSCWSRRHSKVDRVLPERGAKFGARRGARGAMR